VSNGGQQEDKSARNFTTKVSFSIIFMFDSTNDGNRDIVTRNFTNLPQGLNCVTWNDVSPSYDGSAKNEADNSCCRNAPVECKVPCGWHFPVEESLLRPTHCANQNLSGRFATAESGTLS